MDEAFLAAVSFYLSLSVCSCACVSLSLSLSLSLSVFVFEEEIGSFEEKRLMYFRVSVKSSRSRFYSKRFSFYTSSFKVTISLSLFFSLSLLQQRFSFGRARILHVYNIFLSAIFVITTIFSAIINHLLVLDVRVSPKPS